MTIARIQSAKNYASGVTSLSLTFSATPTNGNFLVIAIGTNATSNNRVSSITQIGATWVQATSIVNAGGSTNQAEIWYAENVSGAASTLLINLASSQNVGAIVAEYSNVKITSSLDQVATNSFSTFPALGTPDITGTTSTTTVPNELWFGMLSSVAVNNYSSADSGFTFVDIQIGGAGTAVDVAIAEKIVTATGTAGCKFSISGLSVLADSVGCIATFKDVNPGSVANTGFFAFMGLPA